MKNTTKRNQRYPGEVRREMVQQGSSGSMATNGLAINGERPNVDAGHAIGIEHANNTSEKETLFKRRVAINIGTWNVRTMKDPGYAEILTQTLESFDYDIIGLCETRVKDVVETNNMILSGNKNNKHANGVGFILSQKAKRSILSYNPISDRLITARFQGQPFNLYIVQAYAPATKADKEKDKEESAAFYQQLQQAIDKKHKRDILIVMGDFNAKVGKNHDDWPNVIGKFGYGEMNEKGEVKKKGQKKVYSLPTRTSITKRNRKSGHGNPPTVQRKT